MCCFGYDRCKSGLMIVFISEEMNKLLLPQNIPQENEGSFQKKTKFHQLLFFNDQFEGEPNEIYQIL
jgi:hypothetical protein